MHKEEPTPRVSPHFHKVMVVLWVLCYDILREALNKPELWSYGPGNLSMSKSKFTLSSENISLLRVQMPQVFPSPERMLPYILMSGSNAMNIQTHTQPER